MPPKIVFDIDSHQHLNYRVHCCRRHINTCQAPEQDPKTVNDILFLHGRCGSAPHDHTLAQTVKPQLIMSTPDTPFGNPISGHATPLPEPSNHAQESIVSSSTGPQLAKSISAEAHCPPQPATTLAPLLQPLRRRPPKPKPDASSPEQGWQHVLPPEHGVWAETASATPVGHPPVPVQVCMQYGGPPPEAAYLRGGHLLGGYNTARYSGNTTAHPKFNTSGRVVFLTNASSLQPWEQQTSYIARSLSCFDELSKRFTSFPQACTVQLFICETRFATAFRVLEGSISGPVWAYMRVLGYSSIPDAGEGLMSPTPADCFEYAKLAASRMAVPGTPEQPAGERKRMVQEVLTAQATDYPGERVYKKGIQWLRLACDNHIRQGDYVLAESLYDPLPDWAPRPSGCNGSVTSAATVGDESPLGQNGDHITAAVEASKSPGPIGSANTAAPSNPSKLVPEGHKPNKRKRAKTDVGPKPSKPGKPPVGTDTTV